MQALNVILGAILGCLATVVAAVFGYWNTDRGQDIRMVEIALSIMAGENQQDKSLPGRKFALRTLEKYSGVDIPDDEFEKWAQDGVVPEIATTNYSGWLPASPALLSNEQMSKLIEEAVSKTESSPNPPAAQSGN